MLSILCGLSHSSGVGHLAPLGAVAPNVQVAQVVPPPFVTAQSSQYFERTFNRLVIPPPVFEHVPFAQVPVQVASAPSVIRVAPARPIIQVAQLPPLAVEPVTKTVPAQPVPPAENVPFEPNVAIAVATAHAVAPVTTILLPPYPFVPPHTIGFIPPVPPINVPDEDRQGSTTQSTTIVTQTTPREPEPTTPIPLPSNTANSFAQAQPSNQNVNFNQVYGPPPRPPQVKPQKLKTSVEVVPVPLEYISPPPLLAHLHHHHHHHHPHHGRHNAHIHTFVPAPTKLIVRPVRLRKVRVPVRLVNYRGSLPARTIARSGVVRTRETEPTTFNPINRPITKPPRV